MKTITKRLYTIVEAANYLGRTPNALRMWLRRECPLPVIQIGTRIFLDIKDMDAFIERNRQGEI